MTKSESFKRGISPKSAWPWKTSEDSMTPILTDEDIDRVVVNNGYDGVEPQFDYDFRKFARSLESLILSRLGGGGAVVEVVRVGSDYGGPWADCVLCTVRPAPPIGTKLYTTPPASTPAAPSAMPGELPPMPEHTINTASHAGFRIRGHTDEAMREYAASAVAAAMGGEGKANG